MELNKYIEHTLLKQNATTLEIKKLCEEAVKYDFLGVCINGCNVKKAKELLTGKNIKIITVVGFPLGACTSQTKAFEAKEAIENGADEIDMVINVQAIKDCNYEYVQNDIETVKHECKNIPLKVIIETDLLTKEEIKKACEIIIAAKADFAKTSTGFVKNGVGAKAEDIELMAEVLKNSGVKIKASGGIKTKEQALTLISAGALRLGTSSGTAIING